MKDNKTVFLEIQNDDEGLRLVTSLGRNELYPQQDVETWLTVAICHTMIRFFDKYDDNLYKLKLRLDLTIIRE